MYDRYNLTRQSLLIIIPRRVAEVDWLAERELIVLNSHFLSAIFFRYSFKQVARAGDAVLKRWKQAGFPPEEVSDRLLSNFIGVSATPEAFRTAAVKEGFRTLIKFLTFTGLGSKADLGSICPLGLVEAAKAESHYC